VKIRRRGRRRRALLTGMNRIDRIIAKECVEESIINRDGQDIQD